MKIQCISLMALYLCFRRVTGKSHCVGTCYSGKLFPDPQEIFRGKHLKGYSYNNITTDDPVKCYSSCVQDCRCKACQMKDARCELLDEDKASKAENFAAEPGYVYFDLKQTMYEVKSHMLPPGCYNGCCRSHPCMNGGTCEELCTTPKKKFACKCSSVWYHGKVCEKKYPSSCLEILKNSPKGVIPADGNYTIMLKNNLILKTIYCSFVAPNRAWALMESFSLANNDIFKRRAFYEDNFHRNNQDPNWEKYRLHNQNIRNFHAMSTMFRITCDFPKRGGNLTPDYAFGYLRDYDIIMHGDTRDKCFTFTYINIRGHDFYNVSVNPIQMSDRYHFHLDCGRDSCNFDVPGHISGEDCFGYYNTQNKVSKCNESPKSTTQFWLGQEL